MKRLWVIMLANLAGLLWNTTALADPSVSIAASGSLNFTPPSTDFSMVFLANIFGVVDGVLAGTGSQVMGEIFGIFNSAVLTLGGIVLMYTMLVSTLNTAHEGELLGKRWSSMWIPLRTVAGVGLLLPKASGYCTMQVFVMWVVVQGVGAADKIWDAALGYMQTGGVLIQPVAANNIIAGTGTPADSAAGANAATMQSQAQGAAIIAAQTPTAQSMLQMAVCRYVIQNQLSAYSQQAQAAGQCNGATPPWYCTPNTDLMSGADFMAAGATSNPVVQVPSVSNTGATVLNGLCGTITWSAWTASNQQQLTQNVGLNVDPALMTQAGQARTIAVIEMWQLMDALASTIVQNRYNTSVTPIPPLGISSADGLYWSAGITGSAPLLTGTEIASAAATYLGIMTPTLTALSTSLSQANSFINGAMASGWIMAGSYFFNLANLNSVASGYANDNGTVVANSSPAFCFNCLSAALPNVFTSSVLSAYQGLMGAQTVGNSNCGGPNVSTGIQTVSSYLCNASVLKSMGQVGTTTPQFVANFQTDWQTIPPLPDMQFNFGFLDIPGMSTTFGYMILRTIMNMFIQILNNILGVVLDTIFKPILLMTIPMFTNGLSSALANYTNPIIALAEMGNNFINLATAVWLLCMIGTTVLSAIPYTGTVGVTVAMLIMPFISSWMGAMFGAGAVMAYYIPLMPYMLFTFGGMGWFIAVIESMVAAPIIALGVTFPEGHDFYGKAEPAVMMLVNVFLRPGLMIIGFVTGIILAYVGIWMLNAGFQSAITGLIGPSAQGVPQDALWAQNFGASTSVTPGAVSGFAAIIGIIFLIVIYITMYITIVKTALEQLMFKFADDLLKWLGGGGSQLGDVGKQGMQDAEGAVSGTAGALSSAAGQAKTPSGGKKEGDAKSGASGGAKAWKGSNVSLNAAYKKGQMDAKGTTLKMGGHRKKQDTGTTKKDTTPTPQQTQVDPNAPPLQTGSAPPSTGTKWVRPTTSPKEGP